ncbi:MAG: condensation domain-containing protein, partial [Chloroflexota bacterium]
MTDKAEQIAEAKRKLLEKRLKAKRSRQNNQETVETFPKFPEDTPIPATWGQQSMWYVQQIAPDSAVYNMANVMRINGALNLDWLQQSLDTIVARHEILRTNFVTIDGEIYQQVNPPQSVPMMIEAVSDETLNTAIYKHIEDPFDLASDALFRATLLQLADDVAVLVIAMHHIISDKWSLEVLIRQELATIYTALSAGHEPELDPIDIQFKDFTGWQASKANTDAYQAKLAYWVEQLSDAPVVLDLPFDKPRPAQQQFDGEVLYQTLPASLTEKLQAMSRANNATLFMTLMATYMILLHRMSREDDILVGTS